MNRTLIKYVLSIAVIMGIGLFFGLHNAFINQAYAAEPVKPSDNGNVSFGVSNDQLEDKTSQVISEHSHVLEKMQKVNPTCTKPGHEEYYICSICNKLFSDPDAKIEIKNAPEIPAKGHVWNNWKVKRLPTNNNKGILVKLCKKCLAIRTRTISALKAEYRGKCRAKKKTFRLDTSHSKVFLFYFTLKTNRKFKKPDTIKFTVKGKSFNGRRSYKYKETDVFRNNRKLEYFWYTTGTKFKPGRYKISISSKRGRMYSISYKVKKYKSYATSLNAKKTLASIKGSSWLDVKSHKPAKSLLWGKIKSSNPKIISAHYDGWAHNFFIVGHHRPGKVTLTITLANKKKYKVIAQIYKPFLRWNRYSLYIGQGFKDPFFNYHGKVKYWSSNPSVATVSQKGKVKAVGYGTCYIYAKGGKWKDKTKVISSYKHVRKGMTKKQVKRSSWGSPNRKSSNSRGWTLWRYGDGSYVLFKNGRVVYWYNAAN